MAVFGRRDDLAGGGSRLKALLIPLYLLASAVGLLLPPRPSYSWWGTTQKFPDPSDSFTYRYKCMVSGVQPGDDIRIRRLAGGEGWYTITPPATLIGADYIRGEGIAAPDGSQHDLTGKFKFDACICGCYYYHIECHTTTVLPGLWSTYFVTRGTCMGFVPDC